jgi:hypothetical protein
VILALAVKDVVRVAVVEAKALDDALAYVYVGVPVIGTPAFRNCTAPDGARPRLWVLTIAVRVTDVPDETVVALAVTGAMVVAA